jgi:hypothetical protein
MARIALGITLVLAACTSNGTVADDDDDVVPATGAWSYADTPVSDTCPGDVKTEESGAFAIDQVSAAGFRIIPNDGSDPFTCDLSGADFNCPDRVKDIEDLRPSVDAVITVHASATGSFSSDLAGTGSQNANATCAGNDCDIQGDVFPCSASVHFTIHAQ